MKISEQITNQFFTLPALVEAGFAIMPGPYFFTTIENLQKFTKAICDKIQELESDPVSDRT